MMKKKRLGGKSPLGKGNRRQTFATLEHLRKMICSKEDIEIRKQIQIIKANKSVIMEDSYLEREKK